MKTIHTRAYKCLELMIKPEDANTSGWISLKKTGDTIEEAVMECSEKRWLKFPVEAHETYQLTYENITFGMAYLSGCDNILEKGVRHLQIQEEKEISLSEHYDTLYRDQYHFMVYKNWMNDPNGLCWYQGYYHFFYQANPFAQEWDSMYWGHAVSKDMVHWNHLPFVLEPQQELLKETSCKGGAFSGCAWSEKDKVYFYLTRHFEDTKDKNSLSEWQTMMESHDMIHFTPEKVIIKHPPEKAGADFRDPKVSKIGDVYYMVIASNMEGQLAMLLYSSENLTEWTYENPLILDKEPGATTYECPDFFELDGKYIALAGLMKHKDEYGRYQLCRYYIGDFKNKTLNIEHTGWLDFGGDFYAVQTFLKEDQRIALGWTSDFHSEHQIEPEGSYGGFAIPRVMHIENNSLYMRPIPQIYQLKEEMLYDGTLNQKHFCCDDIKENCYYAELTFNGDTKCNILLGKNGDSEIRLLYEDGIIELKTKGVNSEYTRFPAEIKHLEQLEIFVDRRTVEVYVNRGFAVGTKIFYNNSKKGVFEGVFADWSMLSTLQIYKMKSIWKED